MKDHRSTAIYPYLGIGEQGQMRLEALKRIAADAGFVYDDGPSLSRWLQHLADERIREEGGGYHAVLTRRDQVKYVVFLAQRPERRRVRRVEVTKADGSVEIWEKSDYVGLLSESGARAMLRGYGVEIGDSEPVVRDKWYAIGKIEPEKPVQPWAPSSGRTVRKRKGKNVHTRFRALLTEKLQHQLHHGSYVEISKLTGIHPATVRRYALDCITAYDVRTLDALCKFLGCTIDELLVIEEEATP